MLAFMSSVTRCSCSAGLNCTSSQPASATGMCPVQVERVAGVEDLVVVREAVRDAALEYVPPVWAWAVVVRHPLQQRGAVDVLRQT